MLPTRNLPCLSVSDVIQFPQNPVSWSEEERERNFLNATTRLTGDGLELCAIYHQTLGTRMRLSEASYSQLREMQIQGDLVMSNSRESIATFNREGAASIDSVEFSNILYILFVTLRSSLNVLAQELANFYKLSNTEGNIDFDMISRCKTVPVQDKLDRFRQSETYQYLNDIRRTLEHRRVPLLVQRTIFDINKLHAIRPVAIPGMTTFLLPDNPLKKPKKATYDLEHELYSTLKGLLKDTREFVFAVYGSV